MKSPSFAYVHRAIPSGRIISYNAPKSASFSHSGSQNIVRDEAAGFALAGQFSGKAEEFGVVSWESRRSYVMSGADMEVLGETGLGENKARRVSAIGVRRGSPSRETRGYL